MTHKPLTRAELTARATEAAQRYRDLAGQCFRPRSSRYIARRLELIATGHLPLAADYEDSRSRLGERVRAGIASGEIDPATVVLYGVGRVSDAPQSKLHAVIQAALVLGGSGRYVVGGGWHDPRGERAWLVFGPVISDVEV